MNCWKMTIWAAMAMLTATNGNGSSYSQGPSQGVDAVVYEVFPKMDIQLMGSEKRLVLLRTDLPKVNGRITYDTLQKHVVVHLVYKVQGLSNGILMSDPTLARSIQAIALDFWPTEVVAAGPLRIVIAGLSPRGGTLIHVLNLKPVKNLPRMGIDLLNGSYTTPELNLVVLKSETILRTSAESERFIGHMWNNRGSSGRVFAQFQDTREINEIDILTGEILGPVVVQPADAPANPTALVEPALKNFFYAANGGDHYGLGYLYWMYNPNTTNGTYLIFHDEDRDGVIDKATHTTEWSSEYAGFQNYAVLR